MAGGVGRRARPWRAATLFDGRPWFIEPADAPADAVAAVRALIVACGGRPVADRRPTRTMRWWPR